MHHHHRTIPPMYVRDRSGSAHRFDMPSPVVWLRAFAARHPGTITLLCLYVFVREPAQTTELCATLGAGWVGWHAARHKRR